MSREQTTRLIRPSEDITAVSRAEEHQLDLHPVRVSVAQLTRSAVESSFDRYAEHDVALRSDACSGLPTLLVDPDRIGQVLANLLDNALRHTPTGGSVTVSAAADADGSHVRIIITDPGVGISTEHLPHVFERFYRADSVRDREHGGSGIGLAIAKALVEAHAGMLTAASDGPGRGASFTVTLPVNVTP